MAVTDIDKFGRIGEPVQYDLTATIATSGTTSGAVDLGNRKLVSIFLPSTFDGTTITFTASTTLGGTYVAVLNPLSGAAVSYTVAASRVININPADFAGLRFIKIVAGTTQSTTDTILTLGTLVIG